MPKNLKIKDSEILLLIINDLVHDKEGKYSFALASLVRKEGKEGKVVQISGKARNLNHISSFLRAKRAKSLFCHVLRINE